MYQKYIKRPMDFILSLFIIIIISPIMIIVAIIIKATMPGPIFFTQERVGKNKRIFNIIKFRTMKVDKEAEKGLDFSKDQQRLTKTGKFLRRLKIDELPQLINVLKGDMSLIGPRPTVMEQVENYTDYQIQRLLIKPGMTGMAQVHGNTALTWENRIDYDIMYVNNISMFLDCKILLKTLAIVVFGEERFKTMKPIKMKDEITESEFDKISL